MPGDTTHPVYPLDPEDGRVDTLLMGPGVNPEPRQPKPWERPAPVTPYPVDLMECLCGAHIWLDQSGHRYEHGGFPHQCPPGSVPDGNLSALADDIADMGDRKDYWQGGRIGPVLTTGADRSEKAQDAPNSTETVTGTADPLKDL